MLSGALMHLRENPAHGSLQNMLIRDQLFGGCTNGGKKSIDRLGLV